MKTDINLFFYNNKKAKHEKKARQKWSLFACTGKHCIFGHLGLVFIWSCFVFSLLFVLFYVICAPVPAEGTQKCEKLQSDASNIVITA